MLLPSLPEENKFYPLHFVLPGHGNAAAVAWNTQPAH